MDEPGEPPRPAAPGGGGAGGPRREPWGPWGPDPGALDLVVAVRAGGEVQSDHRQERH